MPPWLTEQQAHQAVGEDVVLWYEAPGCFQQESEAGFQFQAPSFAMAGPVRATPNRHHPRSGDREMSPRKQATPDHPIHELLSRWSPYAFADRPVSARTCTRFSRRPAGRRPPTTSSRGATSWRQKRTRGVRTVLSCLVEGNQAWAKAARCSPWAAPPDLCPQRQAQRRRPARPRRGQRQPDPGNDGPRPVRPPDDRHPARSGRELYHIPEGVRPLTGLAIGYPDDPETLCRKSTARPPTGTPDAEATGRVRVRRASGGRPRTS